MNNNTTKRQLTIPEMMAKKQQKEALSSTSQQKQTTTPQQQAPPKKPTTTPKQTPSSSSSSTTTSTPSTTVTTIAPSPSPAMKIDLSKYLGQNNYDIKLENFTPVLSGPLADVKYYKYFFTYEQSKAWFDYLSKTAPFKQPIMTLYNKQQVKAPRLRAAYGDEGLSDILESQKEEKVTPWCPAMKALKETLKRLTGQDFNFCICQMYRDGNDSIGFHSDRGSDCIDRTIIASVNFGATREMQFKPMKAGDITKVELHNGTVALMGGNTQFNYLHAIPKQKNVTQPRINLTFRLTPAALKKGYVPSYQ